MSTLAAPRSGDRGSSRRSLVRLGGFVVGVIGSTMSTYLLFLAFSHRAELDDLGRFALGTSLAGLVVRLVDGVSTQRLAQVGHLRSTSQSPGGAGVGPAEEEGVRRLLTLHAGSRTALGSGAAVVVGLGALPWGLPTATCLAAVTLGQCWVALVLSNRLFDRSRQRLLVAQGVNAVVFTVAAGLVLASERRLSAGMLLLVQALVSCLASAPFLVQDLRASRASRSARTTQSANVPFRDWFLRPGCRRQTASLVALHATNAATASADSFLAGSAGLRAVAEYQTVQRPLLALGALNTAVGQYVLNRFSGRRFSVGRALILATPALVVWPLLGLLAAAVVDVLAPNGLTGSASVCVVLAEAYALGAISQITGGALLLAHRAAVLVASATAQLLVLVAVGLLLVPALRTVGVAAAVLSSRAVLVLWHLAALGRQRVRVDAR